MNLDYSVLELKSYTESNLCELEKALILSALAIRGFWLPLGSLFSSRVFPAVIDLTLPTA